MDDRTNWPDERIAEEIHRIERLVNGLPSKVASLQHTVDHIEQQVGKIEAAVDETTRPMSRTEKISVGGLVAAFMGSAAAILTSVGVIG